MKHMLSNEKRMAVISRAAVEALAPLFAREEKTAFSLKRQGGTMHIKLKSFPQPFWDGFPCVRLTSQTISCRPHFKEDAWQTLADLGALESEEELDRAVKETLQDFFRKVLYLN